MNNRGLRTIILTVAGFMLTSAGVLADEVYSKTESANRLYKQGKFEEALRLYEDALLLSPGENRLKMNRGSALYNTGDLDGAEKSYQGALAEKDKKTLAAAHYNLGNILFKKGEAMQQQGTTEAQKTYKQALEHYIQSLDIEPADYDAKWNLQLAHQRVKMLEQQQQENKDSDKKQPEPSEHAKKIKAEADRLVRDAAYKKALGLMTNLLKTDSTAVSFGSYTKRLNDVVDSQ